MVPTLKTPKIKRVAKWFLQANLLIEITETNGNSERKEINQKTNGLVPYLSSVEESSRAETRTKTLLQSMTVTDKASCSDFQQENDDSCERV